MMPEPMVEASRPRCASDGRIINAMSVDIEEYFQVGAFEKCIARADWDSLASRVDHATQIVLDLFAEKRVHATFFVLGWVAERQPRLMQRIVEGGHEVASHGYDHARVHLLDRLTFAADIARTKDILEQAAGIRVRGYRAPSFSIGARNRWALEELAAQGYAYSSSVYPIAHDHYGWPGAPRFAFQPVAAQPLVEVPMTTIKLGRHVLPCSGGGFFRLFPYALSRWMIRRVNQQEQQPAMFYFHPWEVDVDQPVQRQAPLKSRLRHYVNLHRMAAKIGHVLDDFHWDRVDRVFLPTTGSSLSVAA